MHITQFFTFAVTYTRCCVSTFNCYLTVGPKIFCQIIVIFMGSDPALFFANFFLYFYKSRWMNKLKKNDLIKARKVCNIFRFIDDLNSISDRGEFKSNYSNIYHEELQIDKKVLINISPISWI